MDNNFIGAGENAAMLSGAEYDEEKGSYIMPKRKTALRIACEKLYDKGYKACTIDGFCANQGLDKEECIVCIQRHFQEQADIPDGWNVVKELYNELKENIKYENSWVGSSRNEEVEREERVIVYERLVKELEQKLQQAGIWKET